jgi:hypothetical protein
MNPGTFQQNSGQETRMSSLEAILQRLPNGVEYPLVHMILSALPPMLHAALWVNAPPTDEILTAFNHGTYGAVDRLLRRHEKALVRLPENDREAARTQLDFIRNSLAQHLLSEALAKIKAPGDCWIRTGLMTAGGRERSSASSPLSRPGAVIDVWTLGRDRRAHRLATERIAAGPPPWGDERIPWVDPVALDKLHLVLLRKYCRPLFRLRVGHAWRTSRAPSGWKVLSQQVIPQLYDYLLPYYPVRALAGTYSPGTYPLALLRDIRDLLAAERADLAAELTVEQVTAAVQRHLKSARRDRPLGRAMFQAHPKLARRKHRTKPR